jgi:hypothetical protein
MENAILLVIGVILLGFILVGLSYSTAGNNEDNDDYDEYDSEIYLEELDPEVFLKAADLILEGRIKYCCIAISKFVSDMDYAPHTDAFKDRFGDEEWFGMPATPERQKARYKALIEIYGVIQQAKKEY